MTLEYCLPANTCKIFTSAINNCKCSNFSLLLDRYFGYENDKEKQKSEKLRFFQSVKNPFDEELVKANYKRWNAVAKFLKAKTFKAQPEWRMVVGLGQTSILETSMTLDRITGIPIIPGSALKGLAASYAMLCALQLSLTEDSDIRFEAEKNETFKAIFGTQGEAGRVIFLDAVPTESPQLEPDIMNNHYQEYYSDKTGRIAPTPYQSPVPVYFLTLGKKSQFAFAVAGRERNERTEQLVNIAIEWLSKGLSELGIGAKTAAGYGYLILDI